MPNRVRHTVPLQLLLESEAFIESEARLPVVVGYSFEQRAKVIDLAEAPHILVAGATKQGKSVCLRAMAASLLHSKHPDDLKLVLIDPKCTEFQIYRDLSGSEGHDVSVITKAFDSADTLEELCEEVDRRYDSEEKHPYIVCFIDEYADLTVSFRDRESKALSRRIMTAIIRIAQRGRGVGIHMVIATQRPTVDVITGLIKANFPTRIAFRTASRIDSCTILDQPGAERLIGNGDMLFFTGTEMERLQCAFVSDEEVGKSVSAR